MRVYARTSRRTAVSGGLFTWIFLGVLAGIGYMVLALFAAVTFVAVLPIVGIKRLAERNRRRQRRRAVRSRAA